MVFATSSDAVEPSFLELNGISSRGEHYTSVPIGWGHTEVLKWAREHEWLFALAADAQFTASAAGAYIRPLLSPT